MRSEFGDACHRTKLHLLHTLHRAVLRLAFINARQCDKYTQVFFKEIFINTVFCFNVSLRFFNLYSIYLVCCAIFFCLPILFKTLQSLLDISIMCSKTGYYSYNSIDMSANSFTLLPHNIHIPENNNCCLWNSHFSYNQENIKKHC